MDDAEDIEMHQYTMSVFTWNLAGRKPERDIDFASIFRSNDFTDSPDIGIIAKLLFI